MLPIRPLIVTIHRAGHTCRLPLVRLLDVRLLAGLLATLVLAICTSAPAVAASSVWKVSGQGGHLYLGGTVHVLFKSSYPLPEPFEWAYRASSRVVFEVDMATLRSPENQMKMVSELRYAHGTSLQDHLKPQTWQKLNNYLDSRGLPAQMVRMFKPGMVMSLISMTEMSRAGEITSGVDEYFAGKANADGKQTAALETFEQQMSFLSAIGERDPDHTIEFALRGTEKSRDTIRRLISAWQNGNVAKIDQMLVAPTRRNNPGVYKRLFVSRNHAWLPQLEAMLGTPQVELVLVGAGHLAGRDGVLKLLEQRGYRVEPL